MSYQPIENYGVIGDLYTVALVGADGSIDFLSWPHFDSPTIFAAMLDDERGGYFRLAPVFTNPGTRQTYHPDTNVLFTRFLSQEGVAEVLDFMPVEATGVAHNLVRRAHTIQGQVRFRMICAPRFDYARASHKVESTEGGLLFSSQGSDRTAVRLRSTVPLRLVNGDAVAEFVLPAGEFATFVLEDVTPGQPSAFTAPGYVDIALAETLNFWRHWVARGTYRGRWRERVNRSALTLKLLTSAAHGSIVAAPTFGLPELIGGVRNWDYRYTWIRDAAFTLSSLMRIGYTEEAAAFMAWLEARCGELGPDGSLQVVYRIDGRHDLPEEILPHLRGYQGSAPVRIGNAAYKQMQLDIYGELMDAINHYDEYGQPISHDLWVNLRRLMDYVCANWQQPDEGIWEVRGGRQQFLLSRVMCWVAIDRALRIAQRRSLPAPTDCWVRERDRIYEDVFENFWHPGRRAFVQHLGSNTMDAAALLMPLMNFIAPTDPRWLSTMRAIERDLVEDCLVYRYRTALAAPDGLSGTEGTFCMCSFWYIDCLAKAGEVERARFLFEKMHAFASPLGLYPEELGPRGEHLGNFPQAFTHLALIRAARMLDRALSAARHEE